jgi:hypothetical protein
MRKKAAANNNDQQQHAHKGLLLVFFGITVCKKERSRATSLRYQTKAVSINVNSSENKQ